MSLPTNEDGLRATVSVGMTKQVRQYEPINVHVSVQGITPDTPMEEIDEFCTQTIPEAIKTIGKRLKESVDAEISKLRDSIQ